MICSLKCKFIPNMSFCHKFPCLIFFSMFLLFLILSAKYSMPVTFVINKWVYIKYCLYMSIIGLHVWIDRHLHHHHHHLRYIPQWLYVPINLTVLGIHSVISKCLILPYSLTFLTNRFFFFFFKKFNILRFHQGSLTCRRRTQRGTGTSSISGNTTITGSNMTQKTGLIWRPNWRPTTR